MQDIDAIFFRFYVELCVQTPTECWLLPFYPKQRVVTTRNEDGTVQVVSSQKEEDMRHYLLNSFLHYFPAANPPRLREKLLMCPEPVAPGYEYSDVIEEVVKLHPPVGQLLLEEIDRYMTGLRRMGWRAGLGVFLLF